VKFYFNCHISPPAKAKENSKSWQLFWHAKLTAPVAKSLAKPTRKQADSTHSHREQ
jgi:hypothetical protein